MHLQSGPCLEVTTCSGLCSMLRSTRPGLHAVSLRESWARVMGSIFSRCLPQISSRQNTFSLVPSHSWSVPSPYDQRHLHTAQTGISRGKTETRDMSPALTSLQQSMAQELRDPLGGGGGGRQQVSGAGRAHSSASKCQCLVGHNWPLRTLQGFRH